MKQRLVVYGAEVDFDKELELFDASDFGMTCVIIRKSGEVSVRNNCTEFHHKYGGVFEISSAFESDKHMTGGTVPVADIRTIVVYRAHRFNEEY